MPELRMVLPEEWRKMRPAALQLFQLHGDQHITTRALAHVRRLRAESLRRSGNVVWAALAGKRLVGVIVVERSGARTAVSVVHKDFRGQGINRGLLQAVTEHLGGFYGEIASRNLASLRSAFAAGLVAYDVFVRRGRITLRLRHRSELAR